ncbi:hypothetical protein MRB53_023305 [Persea americana]|uniref:Uncharacterized protein n=1 Tax=Persea americana TaxID=3435 RepID=A0ACC2L911_PERAE|nr:hypothetical protein MRB53_023305 [Persea americana]
MIFFLSQQPVSPALLAARIFSFQRPAALHPQRGQDLNMSSGQLPSPHQPPCCRPLDDAQRPKLPTSHHTAFSLPHLEIDASQQLGHSGQQLLMASGQLMCCA